jgi:hypothetical protein
MTDQRERADEGSPEAGAETRIDLGAPAGKAPVADGPRSVGALRTREKAARRVEELRKRSALVDAALEAGDTDRRRAGSLLAGGIAFRIFLWLLPAALFAAAVVGLVRPTGGASPERVAQSLGLAASVASTVAEATRQSDQGAAALMAIGIALMLSASMSLVRAMRIAHVLAWGEPFRRPARVPRDGAIFSAAIVALLAIETGITYLRNQDATLSLLLIPPPLRDHRRLLARPLTAAPPCQRELASAPARRRAVRDRPRRVAGRDDLLLHGETDQGPRTLWLARVRRDLAPVALPDLPDRGGVSVSQRSAMAPKRRSLISGLLAATATSTSVTRCRIGCRSSRQGA